VQVAGQPGGGAGVEPQLWAGEQPRGGGGVPEGEGGALQDQVVQERGARGLQVAVQGAGAAGGADVGGQGAGPVAGDA